MIDGLMLAGRVLLAAVFLVAGVAKLLDREGSRRALLDFGVPGILAPWVAVWLPIAEVGVSLALLPLATAWPASIAAFSLLLLFTLAIGLSLAHGRKPDCHCFGQIHSAPAGLSTLIRNALLAGVAGFVAWNGGDSPGPSVIGGLSESTRIEQLGVLGGLALLCLAGVQAALLVQVLRQQGRMLLRLEAIEAGRGDSAEDPAGTHAALGLPIGTQAPGFQLKSIVGAEVSLESLLHAGKPLLLFFTNPKCGPCMSLMPEITRWHGEKSSAASIVLVSRRNRVHRTISQRSPTSARPSILIQKEREVAESYQSLWDPGGRAGPPRRYSRQRARDGGRSGGRPHSGIPRGQSRERAGGERGRATAVPRASRAQRQASLPRELSRPPHPAAVLESELRLLCADVGRPEAVGCEPSGRCSEADRGELRYRRTESRHGIARADHVRFQGGWRALPLAPTERRWPSCSTWKAAWLHALPREPRRCSLLQVRATPKRWPDHHSSSPLSEAARHGRLALRVEVLEATLCRPSQLLPS